MCNAFVRAVATGSLLVGLGLVGLGCANGNPAEAAHEQATAAMDQANAAQSAFDKSEATPINADTRFAAGQLAESRGDQDQALRQYREALKLNPKHLPTLYRLAVMQTELKEYPQAVQTWKTYVSATDGAAAAYGNLGFCYEVAGESNEAEAAYQRGITRDGKDQTCRINYGLMLAAEARPTEALAQFAAVLSPAEAHYNLGSVYDQEGRKEQAKVEYRKALELDPKLDDAQKRLDAMK